MFPWMRLVAVDTLPEQRILAVSVAFFRVVEMAGWLRHAQLTTL